MHVAYVIAAIGAVLTTLLAPIIFGRIIWRAFRTGEIRVPGNRYVIVARRVSRFDFYTAVAGWLARGIVFEVALAAVVYATFVWSGWVGR